MDYRRVKPKDLIGFIEYIKGKRAKNKPENVISIRDIARGHKKTGGLSATTINRILACISSFYEWIALSEEDVETPLLYSIKNASYSVNEGFKGFLSFVNKGNQIRTKFLKVKAPKSLPRPVSDEKIKLLLQSVKTSRDRAVFLLALQGGLRIGEVLGLRFEDINFRKKEITVRFREDNPNHARVKGMKDRLVVIAESEALNCLNDYILYERPDSDSELIFLSGKGKSKGQPLTYQGINTVFNYHCKKLGIKTSDLTLHAFRHTHATKMYEGGMEILSLQKRLGHSSPQSTQIYTKVSDNKLREEYLSVINSQKNQQ
jgi:integrase/recombinase XerD